MRHHYFAALLLVAVPSLSAQQVWTVRRSVPGADFTDIATAIAAAAPGDRIEVQESGFYSPIISAKVLDIEATVSGVLVPRISVQNTNPSKTMRVTGFVVQRPQNTLAVEITASTGRVLIERVDAFSWPSGGAGGESGLRIHQSLQVMIVDSRFRGLPGQSWSGAGADISASHVTLIGGWYEGGYEWGTSSSGGNGMPGIRLLNGSTAFCSDITAKGNNARIGSVTGGDGGDGIFADATSRGLVYRSHIEGGRLGRSTWPVRDGFGAYGAVEVTTDSTVIRGLGAGATSISGRAMLSANAPEIPLGQTLTLDIHGPAGASVWVAISGSFRGGSSQGSGLVEPFVLATIGEFGVYALDPTGFASSALAIPDLAPLRGLDLFFQGVQLAPSDVPHVTSPLVVRLL